MLTFVISFYDALTELQENGDWISTVDVHFYIFYLRLVPLLQEFMHSQCMDASFYANVYTIL